MVLVLPIFHRLSYSNETVRNAPKYEFWVECSGSGAFVAKNSDATLFTELGHLWHQFGQFLLDFRAVTKRSKTPQNMSFGSNGVDRVHSLRKFWRDFVYRTCSLMAPIRLVLHRLSCSNETARNAPKYEFWVQWSGSCTFVTKISDVTLFSELVR
jgi:hypothetical protein